MPCSSALARASGVPARDVYGIRVAPLDVGYKSLGVGAATSPGRSTAAPSSTRRAIGWVPVDPADVRKVVLEEAPGQPRVTTEVKRRARCCSAAGR